eukprot:GFUD01126659.1.p1 GENE.GFUD01126659.1~~GFUD01126659.1.p1  ORF type:complete len:546 (-),score=157.75 GFUD01126659.1:32-1669(-)
MLIDKPGLLAVIKVEHLFLPSGRKNQALLEQTDLHKYQEEHKIPDNFCRKNKESNIQMKFSCWPCRIVIESVVALRDHLSGGKHLENAANPVDNSEYFIDTALNGNWKKRKGVKRPLEETRLSKRERTKENKLARSIPILTQYTEEKYEETETYFENGLRKVRPYHFTFTTHAKGRWVGDKLFDVFAREFRAMEPKEYARCIEAGMVRVNDKASSVDYRVQNNDFISHTVHRHELPVTEQKINIINEDDDWVVVDKPGSIPVHPCGRYRHNSMTFILAKEHGLKTLQPVHRLDRLTSGVLIFSKSAAKARVMEQQIKAREVEKEYVCRVVGEFPEEEIVCEEPIEVISYKIGLCVVDPKGKDCKTTFQRLEFKNGVSIVKCWPKTGRMHQIRVHLQFLGFPITNDPLYNSEIFGPEKGKGGDLGKSHEQLVQDLIKYHTVENWINSDEYEASETVSETEIIENLDKIEVKSEIKEEASIKTDAEKQKLSDDFDTCAPFCDPNCGECKLAYKDPPPESLVMYLHALKYSGDGWAYQTEMPKWATFL